MNRLTEQYKENKATLKPGKMGRDFRCGAKGKGRGTLEGEGRGIIEMQERALENMPTQTGGEKTAGNVRHENAQRRREVLNIKP